MQEGLESSSKKSLSRRWSRIAVSMAGLIILLIPTLIFGTSILNREPPILVMRVDDIQDFAFREAQLFLLNESMKNDVPLSLAIIAGMFGEDREIVQTVKLAVSSGSEMTVHGWKHENLAERSFEEQVMLLSQARSRIKEILGIDVKVLVPPMFSFNGDTLTAMNDEGYYVISTLVDFSEPGPVSNVISLPATVELSLFSNSTWSMKSPDSVKAEISRSIKQYGFAVLVTHPQEFISNGQLSPIAVESYRALITSLK